MFMVDGKLSKVKKLPDGRVAYGRGPQSPASILTQDQLTEIQRLNAKRWVLPYGFLLFGGALCFLSLKAQVPILITLCFFLFGACVCLASFIRSTRCIEDILREAPFEAETPPKIPVPLAVRSIWRATDDFHLSIGMWMAGFVALSAAFGVVAKVVNLGNFDSSGKLHSMPLLLIAGGSSLIFSLFRNEHRRRRIETRDRPSAKPPASEI
ncbi:hypothetical protein ACSBOB_00995 [Mesorhizobium sp. ASY16-5R]|uniref:hypothetical protein n=1 Tax=Mesorhizobium sp. ASY16-5R TaxID=3445772 RepID=UPI003FA019A9